LDRSRRAGPPLGCCRLADRIASRPLASDNPRVADIVLLSLNARYAHASLGARYLLANLGNLRQQAVLMEFDLSHRPLDLVERIVAHRPQVVGLGVYVWNATEAGALAAALKTVRPEVLLVLGGPEISHETDRQEIFRWADYIICGEADLAFARLCQELLDGRRPAQKIIAAPPPDLATLQLPYDLYNADDLAQRVVYVEASRGCPFGCEFCLSSLDVPLRRVPLESFLAQMQMLLDRGLRQFKFVDRTFNLDGAAACAILEFFLQRRDPELLMHFEIIPDRLPKALADLLPRFPPGAVQLEVGVQTLNPDVAQRIGRRQDNALVEKNLAWLRQHTGVHIHADLIGGLPGEDLASFAAGFDRLVSLRPHEIQVGILKRLRGAPIARHDHAWQMVYSPHPPYEVIQTSAMSFQTLQHFRRMARCWDLVANSGNFTRTTELILRSSSVFNVFWRFADFVYEQLGRVHAIAMSNLGQLLQDFLISRQQLPPEAVHSALQQDADRRGRVRLPGRQRQMRHHKVNLPLSEDLPHR